MLSTSKVFIVAVGVLLVLTIDMARAQSTVYDDFNAKEINPALWITQQSGSGGLELIRQPWLGKLVMSHRVVGETTTSTGQNTSRNQLRFRNGSGISTIKFTMKARNLAVLGCEAVGANTSRSLAGFFSALFNDGSRTSSEDQTGDIGAFIFLQRTSDSTDPDNLLRVEAGMIRCASSNCSAVEDIGLLDLGTVAQNENVSLSVSWEDAEKRVRFQKNDEPIQLVNYSQAVVTPRGFRVLEVRGEAANCNVGERPFAKITAVFDNVVVNP
jgi:hypothetical protein